MIRFNQLRTSRWALVFYLFKRNQRRFVCGVCAPRKSTTRLIALKGWVVKWNRAPHLIISNTSALVSVLGHNGNFQRLGNTFVQTERGEQELDKVANRRLD